MLGEILSNNRVEKLFLKMHKVISEISVKRMFSSLNQLPHCEFTPKAYNGPSMEVLKNIRKKNLSPALTTLYSEPVAFHQGHKQWLFDVDGKRYLDMFGGICTVSVGHCHPKICKVLTDQINTLDHVSNVYYHPKIHEYAERLAAKLPGDLKVVYFVNSGSEANDLAILMARICTGNSEILTLKNCYHGMTYQTMGLTSMSHYKYAVAQPAGINNVMNPDVYRGIWGGSHCRDSPVQTGRTCFCISTECEANEKYISQLSTVFNDTVPRGKLAAFFAESIQGVGGTVQFPKDYIRKAYDIVKANNGLFVSDEVQTGFGRTGEHFWGFEMHGIKPDIVTMAKGIGNGFPLGAVVTTPEISKTLNNASHFNTFGGNPLASAVGIAVLDIIEEENLQENSKIVGTYLLLKLETLKQQYPVVGDVRGKGLMIGVELVDGDDCTQPLQSDKFLKFFDRCKHSGLIVGKGGFHGNVVRIKPPMCVTKEDADFTVAVMEHALQDL